MLTVALQVLAKAGRSLSARKILELGEQEGLFAPVPTVEALRAALEEAAEAGGLREVRRGVFDRPTTPPPAPARAERAPARAERAPERAPERADRDDDDGDDRRRRRRRPKAKELLGEEPVAALSVEDAVAEAEQSSDASSLRRKLWDKMRDGAAAAVGEALASGSDDADDGEDGDDAEQAPAGNLRSRLKARMKAAIAAEARERPEAPPVVALAPLTPAARVVKGDPEADLQARLAARRALAGGSPRRSDAGCRPRSRRRSPRRRPPSARWRRSRPCSARRRLPGGARCGGARGGARRGPSLPTRSPAVRGAPARPAVSARRLGARRRRRRVASEAGGRGAPPRRGARP
ncbi:MAG: hypothetical protein R3F43_06385 [bacterium]